MSARSHDDIPAFSVVIPMFNEEAGARACVEKVGRVLDGLANETTLIVVDDGSDDGTSRVLDACRCTIPRLRIVRHPSNRGYGAALRSGVEAATEAGVDYVVFMDSDLTNDPGDLRRFATEMARGADVIKASRYVPGGRVEGVPWKRRVVSFCGNVIGRLLFGNGIRDCTNGFRAVKTEILNRLDLKESGFEIIVEELYQCRFVASTYSEVPTVLGSRSPNLRDTAFTYRPKTFCKYLRYAVLSFLRVHPRSLERERSAAF